MIEQPIFGSGVSVSPDWSEDRTDDEVMDELASLIARQAEEFRAFGGWLLADLRHPDATYHVSVTVTQEVPG